MRRVRAIVSGRVHGVSYRVSAQATATRLGLTGWVRNRSDGSVELEAQGADQAIASLLAWCEHGPPAARVAHVAVDELAPIGADAAFAIRRDG